MAASADEIHRSSPCTLAGCEERPSNSFQFSPAPACYRDSEHRIDWMTPRTGRVLTFIRTKDPRLTDLIATGFPSDAPTRPSVLPQRRCIDDLRDE